MRYTSRGLRRRRGTDQWEVALSHKDPITVFVKSLMKTRRLHGGTFPARRKWQCSRAAACAVRRRLSCKLQREVDALARGLVLTAAVLAGAIGVTDTVPASPAACEPGCPSLA